MKKSDDEVIVYHIEKIKMTLGGVGVDDQRSFYSRFDSRTIDSIHFAMGRYGHKRLFRIDASALGQKSSPFIIDGLSMVYLFCIKRELIEENP